jgi:hypothetical protein
MMGHTRWAFPDGDLPPRGEGEPHGHESLVILNPNGEDAQVRMTIYFTDREPMRDLAFTVGAERVRCIRMDEPVGDQGYMVPFGQYALVLDSTVPVIAQIGRMDVQQPNLAYYTVMGFPVG